MCTVLLPLGGYPLAVSKYITYHVKDIKMNIAAELEAVSLNALNDCR